MVHYWAKFLRHCSNFANCAKSRKWGKARQCAGQSWVDESADNDLRRCHSYEQEVPQQCLSMKKILTSHRSMNYGFSNSILFRNIECSRPFWSSAMTFGTKIIHSLSLKYIWPILTFLHRCQKVNTIQTISVAIDFEPWHPLPTYKCILWGGVGEQWTVFLVLD